MNMNLSSNHQFQPFEDDGHSSPQIISSETKMQEFFGPSPLKLKQKVRRNKPTAEMIELHKGRIIRSTCRKDRHSKVSTAKGPKDRRVRLSPNTAIQFYDVQDRLGYDRPSKAIDWLMREAKTAIDALDDHNSQKNVSENLCQSLDDDVTVQTMRTCCHDSHENQISRLGWHEKLLFGDFQACPDGGFSSTRSCRNEAPEVHRHYCAHNGQQQGFIATSQTCDAAPEFDRLQKIFNWTHTSSSFVDSVPLHFPYGDLTPVPGYSQMCNDDIRELLQSSNSCYYHSENSSRFPAGISFSNEEDILMMGYNADNGLLVKEDGRV